MEEISQLRDQIAALIKSYKSLQKSYHVLEKSCAGKDAEIAALNDRLKETQMQLLVSEAGNVLQGCAEKTIVRRQLDTVIGEIDKILTTLND